MYHGPPYLQADMVGTGWQVPRFHLVAKGPLRIGVAVQLAPDGIKNAYRDILSSPLRQVQFYGERSG